MKFVETKLEGAYIIELEPIENERGFFARSFCRKEFKEHGLNFPIVQCNISFNKKKGTLRGMHYQKAPYREAKLVSCIKGKVYDVIIDLRPESKTFHKWYAIELSADSSKTTAPYRMLYIPKGFAHGFQTLTDNCYMQYFMSEYYSSKHASGVRWDDPAFAIHWPIKKPTVISQKDKNWPLINNKNY
ncbi:MAG: dTDP-4-dehydrorhamnose 3,5-epimerase [Elusimicrobia bacterium]|nr:dTDP-4-dehydrorhamnose 3,5-epimerase [Candidatus Liberimonas magnetica]